MFKYDTGMKVEDRITGLKGIITSRSENLNMCNRYYIQPRVYKEGKVPTGWWVDEADIIYKGTIIKNDGKKDMVNGGLMSKER
ncbi:MAG: hypothetical protein A3K77_00670 [Euryarchaeota archaeon RBG_13_31_8]|nr:MAG: hypothetical protein A3K77_00670 [Euryarchaeota archaeon RBG_13_31_8]